MSPPCGSNTPAAKFIRLEGIALVLVFGLVLPWEALNSNDANAKTTELQLMSVNENEPGYWNQVPTGDEHGYRMLIPVANGRAMENSAPGVRAE